MSIRPVDIRDLGAEVEERAKEATEEDLEHLYDSAGDEAWMVGEVFPQTLRRSLFVTAYSLLEHDLEMLCHDYVRQQTLSLKPKDLHGSGIVRSRAFLKKVAQIAFPDTSPEWTLILRLGEMRNALVHRGGKLIEGGDGELRKFIDTSPEVHSQDEEVVLDAGFVEQVVDIFERFWRVFFQSITANTNGPAQ